LASEVEDPGRVPLEVVPEAQGRVEAGLLPALLALPQVAGPRADGAVLIADGSHLPPVVERDLLDFEVLGHALRRELFA
jgi:hypothetical protein